MAHRSHTELYYHFSWATRNREKVISPAWEKDLHDFIKEKCLNLHSPPIEVNGTEDHVHVLLRGNACLSPASIAQILKGASSKMVNERKLSLSYFVWQDGYGVFSVSPHDVEMVARYIRNQKKHHNEGSAQTEWELNG